MVNELLKVRLRKTSKEKSKRLLTEQYLGFLLLSCLLLRIFYVIWCVPKFFKVNKIEIINLKNIALIIRKNKNDSKR